MEGETERFSILPRWQHQPGLSQRQPETQGQELPPGGRSASMEQPGLETVPIWAAGTAVLCAMLAPIPSVASATTLHTPYQE